MQQYLDQLSEIAADPTSNLVVAALLLAAVTLVILILVLSILILMLPDRSAQSRAAAQVARRARPPRPSRTPVRRSTQLWIGLGVIMITIGTAYGVTSTNDYCANTCHVMAPSANSWIQGTHSEVPCVRCHEGRLVLSIPSAATSRLRQLTRHLTGDAPESAVVPAETCLGCHEAKLASTFETSEGIVMSHTEPLAAGIGCPACHQATAHAIETPSRATIMTRCLECHDGATASAQCATCHIGDPGMSPVFDRIYSTTELPQPTCGGCHSEESCDACHGIRMPHSQAFIEGEHARDAGFYRKEICWNCHVKTDCGGCHGEFLNSHGSDFLYSHRLLDPESSCVNCHRHHEGSFCDRCH